MKRTALMIDHPFFGCPECARVVGEVTCGQDFDLSGLCMHCSRDSARMVQ